MVYIVTQQWIEFETDGIGGTLAYFGGGQDI